MVVSTIIGGDRSWSIFPKLSSFSRGKFNTFFQLPGSPLAVRTEKKLERLLEVDDHVVDADSIELPRVSYFGVKEDVPPPKRARVASSTKAITHRVHSRSISSLDGIFIPRDRHAWTDLQDVALYAAKRFGEGGELSDRIEKLKEVPMFGFERVSRREMVNRATLLLTRKEVTLPRFQELKRRTIRKKITADCLERIKHEFIIEKIQRIMEKEGIAPLVGTKRGRRV